MLRFRLLLAACAAVLLAGQGAAAADARVAILPIVVHTHEEPDYLQAGLADMLASRLGRAPGVAVVRVDGPDRGTTDPEAARSAGAELGADYVLFGSFTRFGEGASLDVRCIPVAGGAEDGERSIFIQSGSLGEVIPRLDGLAEKVSRYVRDGGGAAVAAGAGSAAPADGSSDAGELQDVLSELDALRERVQLLEQRLEPAAEEGSAARGGEETPAVEPELHSDVR